MSYPTKTESPNLLIGTVVTCEEIPIVLISGFEFETSAVSTVLK